MRGNAGRESNDISASTSTSVVVGHVGDGVSGCHVQATDDDPDGVSRLDERVERPQGHLGQHREPVHSSRRLPVRNRSWPVRTHQRTYAGGGPLPALRACDGRGGAVGGGRDELGEVDGGPFGVVYL